MTGSDTLQESVLQLLNNDGASLHSAIRLALSDFGMKTYLKDKAEF